MGAFSGPITASAYRIQGVPKDWKKVFEEMTRARFQELMPGSGKERTAGWVLADDPFSTDFSLATVFRGDTLLLALRQDTVSVSAPQVRFHVEKAVRQRLTAEGRERLTRQEQEDLAGEVRFDLLRRTVPTIRVAELVWNTDSGRAWFFSRVSAMVQPFEELFGETFGVGLVPETPYTAALAGLGEAQAERLLDWDTALLVEPGA
ncbi:MAG: hypothetical protein FJ098_08410 [Deltaproteobacteria bacterium]|nr:hypothetical protein [Deltaproteobacteria bacterium]